MIFTKEACIVHGAHHNFLLSLPRFCVHLDQGGWPVGFGLP